MNQRTEVSQKLQCQQKQVIQIDKSIRCDRYMCNSLCITDLESRATEDESLNLCSVSVCGTNETQCQMGIGNLIRSKNFTEKNITDLETSGS